MQEAFRMNLTPSFWFKSAIRNARLVIYLIVLIVILTVGTRGSNPIPAKGIGGLVFAIFLLIALYLWRMHNTLEKSAKALNESCKTLTIDSQGMTAEGANGTKTSPWAAIHRFGARASWSLLWAMPRASAHRPQKRWARCSRPSCAPCYNPSFM